MALSREEVKDIAVKAASEIIYKRVQKVVDEQTVECEICTNEDELFHLTSVEALERILETRKMEPSGHAKSVSLSANPDHTFGGRVKVTFNRKKLDGLQPMGYVTHHSPAEDAFDTAENKLKEDSGYTRSLDDMRSEIGLQPEVYKQECEWFTRETLPVPRQSVKKIEYFINWPISPTRVDCTGHIPHHIDLSQDYLYQGLLTDINRVRELAKKANVPLEVTSCFPYIKRGWGQYIELNDENLGRFTRGEAPIITHQEPKEECRNIRGCRRE